MVLASRSNRCFRARSPDISFGRIFMATVLSSRVSFARYTSPIPPAPSGARIWYGPSFVPETRGMIVGDYIPGEALGSNSRRVMDVLRATRKLATSPISVFGLPTIHQESLQPPLYNLSDRKHD